jgi:thiol-disulfide isomerase/thioredoxin
MEGEAEEELVKASRTHDGKTYGFCSEKCAEAFAADPVAYLPPVFPHPAPALSLTELAGASITSESLKGKVVLLDFWATWCVPCRKSMPELQALHQKYAGRGFTVVGVSIDEGGPAKVKKFVAAKKIGYPIAMDSDRQPAWDAFHVKAVPAAYLIDQDGQVVARWLGGTADSKEIGERIEALLARAN